MRLLASNEDVLALASDSRNVYTGHSWGIAIYSRTGMPIGRVAVGFPVLSLAVSEGAIWAGGSTGLYRIEKESFRISRVASARLTGPIPALELAGDVLWIGGRNLARLNLKTRELHLFAAEELGIEHSWTDWERFLFDGSYVWVDSRDQEPQGPRRFDTATGRWSALSIDSMRLIGLVDGILWAHRTIVPVPATIMGPRAASVPLEQLKESELYQVDRRTLALKRIQALTAEERPTFWGSYDGYFDGKPRFGRWYYDGDAGYLRSLPDFRPPSPWGERCAGVRWRRSDGVVTCGNEHRENNAWRFRVLANGTEIMAGRSSLARSGDSELYAHETPSDAGGLWFRSPGGQLRRVSMKSSAAPIGTCCRKTLSSTPSKGQAAKSGSERTRGSR